MQRVIHIRRKQRKPEPRKRAHKRRCGKSTSREASIRVDKISLDALVGDDGAHSEDTGADIRHDPVAVSLGRPAVDEEAGGGAYGSDGEKGHAEFGATDSRVSVFETAVDAVVKGRADLRPEPEAQTEGNVVQAADAGGFVVVFRARPEGREGRENKVHDSVDVGHVEGEDLHDGLGGEEAEGTDKGGADDLRKASVEFLGFGMVRLVAGFFAELLGSYLEEFRAVGFPEDYQAADLDDSVGDAGGIEDPAPGSVFGNEPACYRAGGWSQ